MTNEAIEETLFSDGFIDFMKGFGLEVEKPHFLRDERHSIDELLNMYEQDWLSQTGVNRTVEMALREGFAFKSISNNAVDAALLREFQRIDYDPYYPEGLLRQGLCLGRAAGGAIIAMLPEYGQLIEPRRPTDKVKRLLVVPWNCVTIIEKQLDSKAADYGLPTKYRIIKPGFFTGNLELHASRVILCEGATKKNPTPEAPWLSVLEAAFSAIANFGYSWEAISYLLKEYSIMVLKMKGVHGALGTGKDTVAKQRMAAMSRGKSLFKTLFLDTDGGEDATRLSASFSDIPQLMQELSRQVCGAFRTPMTILFGVSPAGLNATGESDLTQYYDYLNMYRRQSVTPKLKILGNAISGLEYDIDYPSLWTPTELQIADLRSKNTTADRALWEMETVSSLQIFVSRARDGSLGFDVDPVFLEDCERRLKAGETDVPGLSRARENVNGAGATGDNGNGATGATGETGATGATGATGTR